MKRGAVVVLVASNATCINVQDPTLGRGHVSTIMGSVVVTKPVRLIISRRRQLAMAVSVVGREIRPTFKVRLGQITRVGKVEPVIVSDKKRVISVHSNGGRVDMQPQHLG